LRASYRTTEIRTQTPWIYLAAHGCLAEVNWAPAGNLGAAKPGIWQRLGGFALSIDLRSA
jgi:hypothetical protein